MLLGEYLVEQGLLAAEAVSRALEAQRQQPELRLGTLLIRQGALSESSLLQALSAQLGLPIWSSSNFAEGLDAARDWLRHDRALARQHAERWQAFLCPVESDDSAITLVSKDPLQPDLQEQVERLHPGRRIRMQLAANDELGRALAYIYDKANPEESARLGSSDLRQLAQDAPVVEFVAAMLAKGTDLHASDIHVEPTENGFLVRYRVDGLLKATEDHARARFDAVISRIKLVSGLDIAERRLPQDGRFSTRAAGVDTEVRVSVIPSVHGESIVLRLLPKSATRRFRLDALGFAPDHLKLLQKSLEQPDGIILVTGPTGSGKSTTLYASLAAVDAGSTRVLTVEDPVEYQLPGITQFQVQSDIGFTFPAALRAILRHDPDTVMVGEIRDPETAAIAIQASLTGHKVLSTLHTNDAPSAFVRLIDIGVEPFLLAASVRTVIAQRLVRRLCPHCAKPLAAADLPDFARRLADELGLKLADYAGLTAVGCSRCDESGYRGRGAVHEVLAVTPQLRHALTAGQASMATLRNHAQPGFRNLQQDAMLKFWAGETSLPEVAGLAASSD